MGVGKGLWSRGDPTAIGFKDPMVQKAQHGSTKLYRSRRHFTKPQTLKPKLTVTLGEAPLPCVTQLLDEMLGESDSTEAMGFELRWCSSAGFT